MIIILKSSKIILCFCTEMVSLFRMKVKFGETWLRLSIIQHFTFHIVVNINTTIQQKRLDNSISKLVLIIHHKYFTKYSTEL